MKIVFVRHNKPQLRIATTDWLVITVVAVASWVTLFALASGVFHLLRKMF